MSVARHATSTNNHTGGIVEGFRTGPTIALPVVVKVRAAVVVAFEGVIELGVTLQVDRSGSPEHVSEIVWL
jgi:hypothetical protein